MKPQNRNANPYLFALVGLVIGAVAVLGFGEGMQTRKEVVQQRSSYKPLPKDLGKEQIRTLSDEELAKAAEAFGQSSLFGVPAYVGDGFYPKTVEERRKQLDRMDELAKKAASQLAQNGPAVAGTEVPKPATELSGQIGAEPVNPLGPGATLPSTATPGPSAKNPKENQASGPSKPNKSGEQIPASNTSPQPEVPIPNLGTETAESQDPDELKSDSLVTATLISDADPETNRKSLISLAKKLGGRGVSLTDFNPKHKPILAVVLFVPPAKFEELLKAATKDGASVSQKFSGGTARRRTLFQRNAKEALLWLSAEREKMREKYEDGAPWVVEVEENLGFAKTALNLLSDSGSGMSAIKIIYP